MSWCCRHGRYHSVDCDEVCAGCGHRCWLHDDEGCVEDGCKCAGWVPRKDGEA